MVIQAKRLLFLAKREKVPKAIEKVWEEQRKTNFLEKVIKYYITKNQRKTNFSSTRALIVTNFT